MTPIRLAKRPRALTTFGTENIGVAHSERLWRIIHADATVGRALAKERCIMFRRDRNPSLYDEIITYAEMLASV